MVPTTQVPIGDAVANYVATTPIVLDLFATINREHHDRQTNPRGSLVKADADLAA
jgi:hypothetical protein